MTPYWRTNALFDVDDIRGASFALVAEGFSPQEVDTRLEELCAAVESDAARLGEPIAATPVVVSQDLSVLGDAIQRARRTVAGLEAFVESDLASMKTACEEQWAGCQVECDRARAENVLAVAEADAKRLTNGPTARTRPAGATSTPSSRRCAPRPLARSRRSAPSPRRR